MNQVAAPNCFWCHGSGVIPLIRVMYGEVRNDPVPCFCVAHKLAKMEFDRMVERWRKNKL